MPSRRTSCPLDLSAPRNEWQVRASLTQPSGRLLTPRRLFILLFLLFTVSGAYVKHTCSFRDLQGPYADLDIVPVEEGGLQQFADDVRSTVILPALELGQELVNLRTQCAVGRTYPYNFERRAEALADDLAELMEVARAKQVPEPMAQRYTLILEGIRHLSGSLRALQESRQTYLAADRDRCFLDSISASQRALRHLRVDRAFFDPEAWGDGSER